MSCVTCDQGSLHGRDDGLRMKCNPGAQSASEAVSPVYIISKSHSEFMLSPAAPQHSPRQVVTELQLLYEVTQLLKAISSPAARPASLNHNRGSSSPCRGASCRFAASISPRPNLPNHSADAWRGRPMVSSGSVLNEATTTFCSLIRVHFHPFSCESI